MNYNTFFFLENIQLSLDHNGDQIPVFAKYFYDKLLITLPLPITTLLTKYFVDVVQISETISYNDNTRKDI